MSERVPRLGDVVDDYCPRCRLLLNHDVASLAKALPEEAASPEAIEDGAQRSDIHSREAAGGLGAAAQPPPDSLTIAKVTCRTCHNTHDYRHAQVPPKRKTKESDKKKLMDQVLAGIARPPAGTQAVAPAAPPEAAPNHAPAERKKRDLWAEYQRIQSKEKKD